MITNTPISDTDKRKWLISSIRGHEQLYSAATMYMIVQQTTGSFTKVMSYDDFFSMILSTAQVLDRNAKDNAQHKCKTNKATKGNSSTKEDSKKHPNSAKSSDTQFSPKDVWAKMSQEEHSKHIEKFHSKPSPSLTKVTKPMVPELLMDPKSPTILILPLKLQAVMMPQLRAYQLLPLVICCAVYSLSTKLARLEQRRIDWHLVPTLF